MNYVLLLAVFVSLYGSDLEMNNTSRYKLRLEVYEKQDSKSLSVLYGLQWSYDCMRDYDQCVKINDKILLKKGRSADVLIDRSCYIGKTGRYQEALDLANEAIQKDSKNLRGLMVKEIWMAALGLNEGIVDRMDDLRIDEINNEQHNLYWLCRSYVSARLKNSDMLAEAMVCTMQSDFNHYGYDCFQRDITFDGYRQEKWFINLIGKTIDDE